MSHGDPAPPSEHPFAAYLRTIGRGPGRARPLTRDEARDAFTMILDQRVEDVQLGAFLLLQRYRGEGAEDLAGFVDATRAHHTWPALSPASGAVDLDWPSYATTANRDAPWFLAAAILAARSGIRILMHGFNGADPEPAVDAGDQRQALPGAAASATETALESFDLAVSHDLDQARNQIAGRGIAYVPLRALSAPLHRLMRLRGLLGLRTPVNTLLKLVNPLAAPSSLQGVFHPPYLELHTRTSVLIGQAGSVAFKGGHGEAERNPQKGFTLFRQQGSTITQQEWPVMIGDGRAERTAPRPLSHLLAVWNDEIDDPVGVATMTGTLAIALAAVEPGLSSAMAQQRADQLWRSR